MYAVWKLQEVADNNCVYRNVVQHSAEEFTQVLQDVAGDPTLPRTKSVRCAACCHVRHTCCHVRHTVPAAREIGEGYPAATTAVIIGISFLYLS
jgi:3'-phosphoadenosine 5'-phosphosulfate sulfotransferase (PAPS reductase)/FAD synthetase